MELRAYRTGSSPPLAGSHYSYEYPTTYYSRYPCAPVSVPDTSLLLSLHESVIRPISSSCAPGGT